MAGRIDINSAGPRELTKIDGIDAERAKNLIAHREAHGPFRSLADVRAVAGFDRALVERVRAATDLGETAGKPGKRAASGQRAGRGHRVEQVVEAVEKGAARVSAKVAAAVKGAGAKAVVAKVVKEAAARGAAARSAKGAPSGKAATTSRAAPAARATAAKVALASGRKAAPAKAAAKTTAKATPARVAAKTAARAAPAKAKTAARAAPTRAAAKAGTRAAPANAAAKTAARAPARTASKAAPGKAAAKGKAAATREPRTAGKASRAREVAPQAASARTRPEAKAPRGRPFDLNLATAEQLQRIEGIDADRARKILAWRDAHGPFTSLEDLDQVPGFDGVLIRRVRELAMIASAKAGKRARREEEAEMGR